MRRAVGDRIPDVRIKCGVWWGYSFDNVPFLFRMAGKSKQIPLFRPVFRANLLPHNLLAPEKSPFHRQSQAIC